MTQLRREGVAPYDLVASQTSPGRFIRATATPSKLDEASTLAAYKGFLCMLENSEKTDSTLLSRLHVMLAFLKDNNLDLNYASIAMFLRQSRFAHNTLRGYLQAGTNYWNFLSELNHTQFNANNNPFKNQRIRGGRQALQRRAFEANDVSALYLAALSSGDVSLAQCIKVAAYTGARIEEICQLKVSDLSVDSISISDSKTTAGIRVIPIHSALTSLIKGALIEPSETYLVHTVSRNKYGKRSDPLTKRFSRLKTKLGFNGQYVFHSIRKTFITLLERADVIEGIASDIVGHEKKTMTYGLYSQGASLSQKIEAIEKVVYPKMVATQ